MTDSLSLWTTTSLACTSYVHRIYIDEEDIDREKKKDLRWLFDSPRSLPTTKVICIKETGLDGDSVVNRKAWQLASHFCRVSHSVFDLPAKDSLGTLWEKQWVIDGNPGTDLCISHLCRLSQCLRCCLSVFLVSFLPLSYFRSSN